MSLEMIAVADSVKRTEYCRSKGHGLNLTEQDLLDH